MLASVPIRRHRHSGGDPSFAVRAFEAGADDCLIDPLLPELLAGTAVAPRLRRAPEACRRPM